MKRSIARFALKLCGAIILTSPLAALPQASLELPSTLDGKIDFICAAVSYNAPTQKYFVSFGPEAVPIVIQKLQQSLAQQVSVEASREDTLMKMPAADAKRVEHQVGLVWMEGVAIRDMSLPQATKNDLLASLRQALHSPYIYTRHDAMLMLGAYGSATDAEALLPLLDDPNDSNRYQAAESLAKIGNKEAIPKILGILEARKRRMSSEQVRKDGSFAKAYSTVRQLHAKPQ